MIRMFLTTFLLCMRRNGNLGASLTTSDNAVGFSDPEFIVQQDSPTPIAHWARYFSHTNISQGSVATRLGVAESLTID